MNSFALKRKADELSKEELQRPYNCHRCGGERLAGEGGMYVLKQTDPQYQFARARRACWQDATKGCVVTKCGKRKCLIIPTEEQLKLLDKGYSMPETAEMVKNGVTAEWLAAADDDA